MADGVPITAGAGTTIATDDCGVPGHAQVVKLAISTDGSATVIPADAANGLDVDVTRIGSTVAIQGDIAHDSVDSGSPTKIGARSVSDVSSATMVSIADRTDLLAGLDGILLVRPHCTIGNSLQERVTISTTTDTACSTFGATVSAKNCITTFVVFNTSTTASTWIDFKGGVGGTVLLSLPLPAGGGAAVNLPVPLVQPTANQALAYQVGATPTGGSVYISLIGFKSKA